MTPNPDKREALISTALRLFAAQGYRAIGIDRILAESGVAKMTLYKHFRSKDALILAVLEERDRVFMDSLTRYVESHDAGHARLAAVFDWHAVWLAREDFRGCLFINAAAEHGLDSPAVTGLAARHKQQVTQRLRGWLQPLVQPRAADAVAVQLSMLIDGAIVAAHTAGQREAMQQAWQAAQVLIAAAR